MSSGASKLGQQAPGQRSIFGGNAMPGFAPMPSYTPVTRGQPEPQPAPQPAPPAQDYGTFGQETPPSYQPTQPAAPQAHPGVFYAGPAQNYQSPAAGTPQPPQAPTPPSGHPGQHPGYPPQQAYPGQGHPSQAHPPQAPQAYGGQGAPGQAYPNHPAPGPAYPGHGAPAHPGQGYPDAGFQGGGFAHTDAGAGLPDADFPDASFPETNPQESNVQDASFPESIFPANLGHVEEEPVNLDAPGQDPAGQHGYDQFNEEMANFAPSGGAAPGQGAYQGQPGQQNSQALAPFEAVYDQPPRINLGPAEQPAPAPQEFYEGERPDADFMDTMDNDQVAPEVAAKAGGILSKFSLKNRSVVMVGSALLGAIALGGALAFAYKQSGGGMSSDTPIVQADASPVKQVPEQPGGKEFPHKNKLIYDRLENGDQPQSEKLVPRQEELALPAMPGAATTPGTVASVDDPTAADGGPRRVKTLVVRPDGSVVPSAAGAAIADGASPQQAVSAAGAPAAPAAQAPAAQAPAAPAQQTEGAAAPAPAAPQPQAPAAAPEQVAAIPAPAKPAPKPKPAAAKAPSSYVVQVGSRKDQTEALAAFADMQQKYPSLLGSYRPMVQKANLGSKGVWYRLRIGPIDDKSAASKLCGQLKSQGHSDCLVMAN